MKDDPYWTSRKNSLWNGLEILPIVILHAVFSLMPAKVVSDEDKELLWILKWCDHDRITKVATTIIREFESNFTVASSTPTCVSDIITKLKDWISENYRSTSHKIDLSRYDFLTLNSQNLQWIFWEWFLYKTHGKNIHDMCRKNKAKLSG